MSTLDKALKATNKLVASVVKERNELKTQNVVLRATLREIAAKSVGREGSYHSNRESIGLARRVLESIDNGK